MSAYLKKQFPYAFTEDLEKKRVAALKEKEDALAKIMQKKEAQRRKKLEKQKRASERAKSERFSASFAFGFGQGPGDDAGPETADGEEQELGASFDSRAGRESGEFRGSFNAGGGSFNVGTSFFLGDGDLDELDDLSDDDGDSLDEEEVAMLERLQVETEALKSMGFDETEGDMQSAAAYKAAMAAKHAKLLEMEAQAQATSEKSPGAGAPRSSKGPREPGEPDLPPPAPPGPPGADKKKTRSSKTKPGKGKAGGKKFPRSAP